MIRIGYGLVAAALPTLLLLAQTATAQSSIDFNLHVRPILAEHCFHCHGPDAHRTGSDLRLDVEADAKAVAIQAGSSANSLLVHRILSSDSEEVMPPRSMGKPLSDTQKQILRQWIDEGAKYSEHWSFVPIADSEQLLRSVVQPGQTDVNPIDAFLRHKLLAVGLDYSAEVTKAQFIRRATMDLIGLPPAWSDVEQFIKDDSPDCYASLIDRLLESPAYGQRWGRYWLDIARYADTHGGAAIGFTTFPFSYTYRDYVIEAFNRDLPVDRFILEQIAADQLGLSDNDPSLAALGFITVGMQFRNYHDTIDDQIDVITRGLMGLTVTCARCHDHKFDPISTKDYYALYATIAPSDPPSQSSLPVIGSVADDNQRQAYNQSLEDLQFKHRSLAREQSDVMRHRLRMQVGLYLAEIAKGATEQDVSTKFLSYRTDDLRPVVLNRWLKYLSKLPSADPVFGPWLEMKSWGNLTEADFQTRRDELIARLNAELESSGGKSIDRFLGLGAEMPKWNPLIVVALTEKQPKSLTEVAAVYGSTFAEHQKLWLQSLIESNNEAIAGAEIFPDEHPNHRVLNSAAHRQLRHHLYGPGTPLDLDDAQAAELTNRTVNDIINGKNGAIHQLNLSSPGSPPRAMITREKSNPDPYFVFLRGNPLARGEQVEPGFLSVLCKEDQLRFENGKRRLGLAQALVDPRNPLTRRVIVNWVWQNHFGTGLVRTPDDFGTRGQSPTHPELLDYLADQLSKHDWSMKWLHRQIMLSRAYQQAAVENVHSREIDPENVLLWRMPRKRLDFESMRDAMLAVSGELDTSLGGRPIDLSSTPTIPRRSVYGFVNRDIVSNLMSTFDVANPNACTAKRPETTVPQQTLFALNSEFIQDRAVKIAEQTQGSDVGNLDARIASMIQRVYGRPPSASEIARAQQFLTDMSSADSAPVAGGNIAQDRWAQLAHALLASNEFLFLD